MATVFAGYQAIQARTARSEAESARDQAARHEQAALQASERFANAAERSATAQERQAEMAEWTAAFDAWEFHYAGAERWMALNRTGHRVWAHVEGNEDRTRKRMRSGQDDLTEVLEGGSFEFVVVERGTLSGPINIAIFWLLTPDAPEQSLAQIINI